MLSAGHVYREEEPARNLAGFTPEIEVDPAVVPVRLLVLENSQLILLVPGSFALRTSVYWDGVKVNDLKRNPVRRAVHGGLRSQRCVWRCPLLAREEASGQCVPTMRMYLPSKSNGVTSGLPCGMIVARLAMTPRRATPSSTTGYASSTTSRRGDRRPRHPPVQNR